MGRPRDRKVSAWSIFVAGSLLFFAVEVLGQAWFDFRITGEPKRFVPELDIVLILAAVEGIRRLARATMGRGRGYRPVFRVLGQTISRSPGLSTFPTPITAAASNTA